jgi:hypothetical protein
VALVGSVVNGLLMVAAIAWYGLSQGMGKEDETQPDRVEGEQQPLLAAAEQRDE